MKMLKTLFIVTGTTQGLGLEIFNQLLLVSQNIVTINRSPFEYKNNILFDISKIENIENDLLVKLDDKMKFYEHVVLILNASRLEPVKEIGHYETSDIVKIVNANTISSLILANFMVKQKKQGILVNISSGGIDFDFEGLGLYTATKIATHKFFKISNIEKNNIEFINFDPGTMKTQMTGMLRDEKNHFQLESKKYLKQKEEENTFTSTSDSAKKVLKLVLGKMI